MFTPMQTGNEMVQAGGMKKRGAGYAHDPMAMFAGAADSLMATDRELFDDIKMRARAVNAQFEQMGKLMQIAGAMGQDTSALMPIMDTLMKEREKMMREIIGKANVPTSASKPAKPQVQRPAMNSY